VPSKPREPSPTPSAAPSAATPMAGSALPEESPSGIEPGAPATAERADAQEAAGPPAGSGVAQAARFPRTVLEAVGDDILTTARRPDAIVYWGGLAGLAALGVLEWPVAAAIGVGVAVANGVRHSRA